MIGRREFIPLVGGAAVWPLAARAQQGERIRRIGVLSPIPADHEEALSRVTAFQRRLQQLGWTVGANLRIEYRWSGGDAVIIRKQAAELVALAPDVILASGAAALGPLLEATRTIPIVFPLAADPVGAGWVESLSRPGGNATGFATQDYRFGGKWLELLKEISPGTTRAAVIRDAAITVGLGMFGAIQSIGPSLGVEVSPINVRDAGEMERTINAFARSSKGGLIVTPSGLATTNRDLIIKLAARHKLPAVYNARHFVAAGGLASYGIDEVDQFQRAAGYVDRIFKGEKPGDLPVQSPSKFELVINLKTAKALGFEIPPTLLARAGEVIE
jgi:putative tryptophan/tyrosine transport system substrate-binding protein